MTAICGGGTSSPKPGVAETVIFSAGALASLLNNKGGAWATIAAPLLGVLSYEATELCNTDPPSTTPLTTEEYTALLQLGPWDTLQSAIGKLTDMAKATIWYELCRCDFVTTPTFPPTVLEPPPSAVAQPATTSACFTRSFRRAAYPIASVSTSPIPAPAWFTTEMFPDLPVVAIPASSGIAAHNAVNWSSMGWTYWGARLTELTHGGPYCPSSTPDLQVVSWNSSGGGGVTEFDINMTAGTTVQQSNPLNKPTTAARPVLDLLLFQCGGTPSEFQIDFWAYCAGQIPGGTQGCCSDPATISILGQLMQAVTLIQRQAAPFATIDGTVHAGLSGNGSFAVQGLIGATVELTTIPQWIGEESGSPDVVFDAGWINWEENGRYTARERITASPMITHPTLAGVYTALHYSLAPGVVATITEQRREF